MNITGLALRNVYRNSHRTWVTILTMAFACAMMIVFASLIQGFVVGSERNIVAMNTGDIQIHRKGYRDDPDIYNLIEQSATLASTIRKAGYKVSERLFTSGLMVSDQSSSGVQLRGIDLKYEHTVTQINQHVMTGHWLDKSDQHGVVIGKKLARLLDVKLGDELVFVGQTADGYMANDTFHLRGILKSVSSTVDNVGVFMSNDMLRELITLPAGAHEMVIMRADHHDDLLTAQEQVIKLVPKDLEVLNWRQLMPIIYRFLQNAQIQSFIMMMFTYIAVASVVLNAMLMSVFERTHEFGIMKALGVRPWQLVKVIYAESFIQTFIAGIVGLCLGVSLSWYLQQYGIDMSSLAEGISLSGIAMDPIWYAALSAESIVMPLVFLFLVTAIAVIYPAIKVAVIRPVDAIHYH